MKLTRELIEQISRCGLCHAAQRYLSVNLDNDVSAVYEQTIRARPFWIVWLAVRMAIIGPAGLSVLIDDCNRKYLYPDVDINWRGFIAGIERGDLREAADYANDLINDLFFRHRHKQAHVSATVKRHLPLSVFLAEIDES